MSREQNDKEPNAFQRAVEPVAGLQRLLAGAREDLTSISRGVQVLPELLGVLVSIQRDVAKMTAEVTKMREGVDELSELSNLQESLDELANSLKPMKRVRDRFRRENGDVVLETDGAAG